VHTEAGGAHEQAGTPMRNQLVVDLALAGPNLIPDPIRWDSGDCSPMLFGSDDEWPENRLQLGRFFPPPLGE
jgi:hypothetical protein